MDTLSHAFFAWFFARKQKHSWLAAIGGILPDLPLLLVGGLAFISSGFNPAVISEQFGTLSSPFAYYFLHSILLFALIGAAAISIKRVLWPLFFGWGLHLLIDLPTHATDGLLPFWPLSSWQFQSPFSYWDLDFNAEIIIAIELVGLMLAICILIAEHIQEMQKRSLEPSNSNGFYRMAEKKHSWQNKRQSASQTRSSKTQSKRLLTRSQTRKNARTR